MHRLRIVGGIDRDGGETGVPAARAMRMAISPRLAISSLWKDMGTEKSDSATRADARENGPPGLLNG